MLAFVLLGCGGRTGAATTTGTGAKTGDVLWTFGDELHPILSDPVLDRQGRIRVAIGIRDSYSSDPASTHYGYVSSDPATAIREADLVTLDQSGKELSRTRVCDREQLATDVPLTAPAVGPGDDVWISCGTELDRVSASGLVLWTAPETLVGARPTGAKTAVSRNGWAYQYLGYGPGPALRAVDASGVERWSATVGIDRRDGKTFVDAPLIGTDGTIYTGCDTCAESQGGVAAFEPQTGSYRFYEPEQSMPVPRGYRPVAFAADGTLYMGSDAAGAGYGSGVGCCYNDATLALRGDQLRVSTDPAPIVIGNKGPVYIRIDGDNAWLDWGDQELPLPDNTQEVLAVAEPDVLVLRVIDFRVLLIDRSGKHLLEHDSEQATRPLVLPGVLVLRNRGHLEAVRAPIDGLSPGPWPILGGNLRNSYSADSDGP